MVRLKLGNYVDPMLNKGRIWVIHVQSLISINWSMLNLITHCDVRVGDRITRTAIFKSDD